MTAAVVAVAFSAGARPAAAGDVVWTIALHVDDHVNLNPAVRAIAEAEVTRIYAAAGVLVTWEDAPVDPSAPPDGLRRLAVVIVDAPANDLVAPSVAGLALRGTGRAYIYYERVIMAAYRNGRHAGSVLGMVIAHEIGHLLLPENSHSPSGIMRDDLELKSMLPREFTVRQSAMIRGNLQNARVNLAAGLRAAR